MAQLRRSDINGVVRTHECELGAGDGELTRDTQLRRPRHQSGEALSLGARAKRWHLSRLASVEDAPIMFRPRLVDSLRGHVLHPCVDRSRRDAFPLDVAITEGSRAGPSAAVHPHNLGCANNWRIFGGEEHHMRLLSD